jgi:CpeT protein
MIRSLIAALALATTANAQNAADFADQAVGEWTTIEQSASPDYDWVYSEILRIWPERRDGVWLYQHSWIIASDPDAAPAYSVRASQPPYFQVVIQLRDFGDGAVHTTTYRLSGDGARTAARDLSPSAESIDFDEDWLGEVACMGHQQSLAPGYWEGAASCPNAYRGGVRVDSRSIRAPGVYVNWDRGFDADGDLVWGPPEGGYIFKRSGGD